MLEATWVPLGCSQVPHTFLVCVRPVRSDLCVHRKSVPLREYCLCLSEEYGSERLWLCRHVPRKAITQKRTLPRLPCWAAVHRAIGTSQVPGRALVSASGPSLRRLPLAAAGMGEAAEWQACQGFLFKLKENHKEWKKLYVVLDGGSIVYYDSPLGERERGIL